MKSSVRQRFDFVLNCTHEGVIQEVLFVSAELAPFLKEAVVGSLRDPDTAAMVDIHVGGIAEHRFAGEEGDLKPIGDFHGFELFTGGLRAGAFGVLRQRDNAGEGATREEIMGFHGSDKK